MTQAYLENILRTLTKKLNTKYFQKAHYPVLFLHGIFPKQIQTGKRCETFKFRGPHNTQINCSSEHFSLQDLLLLVEILAQSD